MKKIFIDTAPYIYIFEETPRYSAIAKSALVEYFENGYEFVTSCITCMEFCVVPYRNADRKKIQSFYDELDETQTDVVSITEEIADISSKIRAKYPTIKSMDALQVACAIHRACEIFFTNDKRLKQIEEINIVVIDEVK